MPPLFTVDAFTDRPFAGNPAAVCLLADRWPDDRWMQSGAAEMNLAETAFAGRRSDGVFPAPEIPDFASTTMAPSSSPAAASGSSASSAAVG